MTTLPDCDTCSMLRRRLSALEEAVERFIVVMNETGAQRMEALTPVVDALTTDFRTAILSSADMTPEQRGYWLTEIELHKALQVAAEAPEAGS